LAARNWISGAPAKEAHVLARRIAGRNPSSAVLTAARRIAEAQIDLVRMRAARQHLIAPGLSDEGSFVLSDVERNSERRIVTSAERCRAASRRVRIWIQSESLRL